MHVYLNESNIASRVILDAAAGSVEKKKITLSDDSSCNRFVMGKVDLVMVGAEGVAESGGIINKVLYIVTSSY